MLVRRKEASTPPDSCRLRRQQWGQEYSFTYRRNRLRSATQLRQRSVDTHSRIHFGDSLSRAEITGRYGVITIGNDA